MVYGPKLAVAGAEAGVMLVEGMVPEFKVLAPVTSKLNVPVPVPWTVLWMVNVGSKSLTKLQVTVSPAPSVTVTPAVVFAADVDDPVPVVVIAHVGWPASAQPTGTVVSMTFFTVPGVMLLNEGTVAALVETFPAAPATVVARVKLAVLVPE
jgi:hypothetical protein